LFFTAKGCAPCKKAGPLLLKLAKKWERQLRLVVVDFDESPLIVEDFSVVELPTIIFLDSDENLVIRVDGASKAGIEVLLVKDGASISHSSKLLI
jgi:thiol-disulfide isomerase/thioredoxin